MNFEIRKTSGKEEYQFHLVDNNQRILSSNTFETREAVTDAIKELIKIGGDANNYAVVQDGNDYFTTISASDGSPLALSKAFGNELDATALKNLLPLEVFDDRSFEITFISTRKATKKVVPKIEMYDLDYKSSGNEGFDTYKKGTAFYYAFNNKKGKTILYGRAQKSGTKRKADIWYLITKSAQAGNYEMKSADGGYYFIFNDRKGKEIARSVIFSSEKKMNNSIAFIQASAPTFKEKFSTASKNRKTSTRKKAGPNDDYNFAQVSSSGIYGFEAFQSSKNKGHYFHFNDDDGKAILFSQNYASANSRDNGIRSVIKNAVRENRYIRKTEGNRHYFILRAGNNQEIARSRMFTSLAAMNAFMLDMRTKIVGFAEIYGLNKETILSSIIVEKETFTLEREEDIALNAIPEIKEEIVAEIEKEPETLSTILVPPILPVIEPEIVEEVEEVEEEVLNTAIVPPIVLPPVIVPPVVEKTIIEPIVEPKIVQETPKPIQETYVAPSKTINTKYTETTVSKPSYVEPEAVVVPPAQDGGDLRGCLARFWPLLLLLALLLLLLMLWKGCNGCAKDIDIPKDNETTIQNDNQNHIPEPYNGKLLGPDAKALGFTPGSAVALMADCLANPNCEIPSDKFTLGIVHFEDNAAHMNEEAYAEMDQLAQLMKAYPNMKMNIFGHIDEQESDEYDGIYQDGTLTLSSVRARCVFRKLTDRGIHKSRMTFKGLADSQPIVKNDSKDARVKNRRVEVVITQR